MSAIDECYILIGLMNMSHGFLIAMLSKIRSEMMKTFKLFDYFSAKNTNDESTIETKQTSIIYY